MIEGMLRALSYAYDVVVSSFGGVTKRPENGSKKKQNKKAMPH